MNYRHAYHAGGIADVFKHAVLIAVLSRLLRKSTPLFVLDTHAGPGLYDLASAEAEGTGEWRRGIGALLGGDTPAALRPYLDVVRRFREGDASAYPGSPAIVDALLRPADRLALCELHPEDAQALKRLFRRAPGVAVHARDGYEALLALIPPAERRGLVLVDPAFEARDEFAMLGRTLAQALRKWPAGRFIAWYPIKRRDGPETLVAALAGSAPLTIAELTTRREDGVNLAGSGLLLVNPPFGIEAEIDAIGRALAEALGGADGRFWLQTLAAATA